MMAEGGTVLLRCTPQKNPSRLMVRNGFLQGSDFAGKISCKSAVGAAIQILICIAQSQSDQESKGFLPSAAGFDFTGCSAIKFYNPEHAPMTRVLV